MPTKNWVRGFTLIELLVVIAIIGILASVVLASLNNARTKANDAAIKSQMKEIGKQAALYQLANGSFGTAFGDDDVSGCSGGHSYSAGSMFAATSEGAGAIVRGVQNMSKGMGGGRVLCRVGTAGGSWAFSAPVSQASGSNNAWCIDSSGASKEVQVTFTANGASELNGSGTARCP